ncbi:hypothetical protein [Streptomyces gossypii]|uniref:hypothetical protein n=1 Tax=Streptomyces gossypii TaxID=2883101 RepID=UPI0035CD2051
MSNQQQPPPPSPYGTGTGTGYGAPPPYAETPYAQTPYPQQGAAPAEPAPAAPAPTVPPGTGPAPPPSRAARPGRASRARPSPLIAPGLQPAVLTTVLAALLAATAPLPRPALAAAVVLLQAFTAAGWFRLNGMWPARQGIALAFLAGVTTDVALLATSREHTPTAVIGTLGIWCVLGIVLQLRNHSSPDERLYALTAGLTSTALTVLAAGYLAVARESSEAVTVGAAAVAAAALLRALPLPPFLSPAVAVLAAGGAGALAGRLTDLGNTDGTLIGLAAGVCALIGLRVASYDYPSRFVHMTAGVALPLTLAAPAVYFLGRALG